MTRRGILVGAVSLLTLGCTTRYESSRFPAKEAAKDVSFDNALPLASLGDEAVNLRYMRAGGLYVQWQSAAVLFAPFVSNPNFAKASSGKYESLVEHIELDFADRRLDPEKIKAIIVGHSHYDHLGDVPHIARQIATHADIWVNEAGANMLHGHTDLRDRIRVIQPNQPVTIERFRFQAFPSHHTAIMRGTEFAPGEVDQPWSDADWVGRKFTDLRGGRAFTFMLDFLGAPKTSDTRTPCAEIPRPAALEPVFSLFYQDAGSDPPAGFPSRPDRPVDVAVMCVPGYHTTRPSRVKRANWNHGYPGQLLEHIQARHVFAIHWESMFRRAYRRRGRPTRLILQPMTGSARFNPFIAECRRVVALHQLRHGALKPGFYGKAHGISNSEITVPIPLEWVKFIPEQLANALQAEEGETAFCIHGSFSPAC